MKIILGSSSKYRQQVLREAGFQFEVMPPDIDEKAIRIDDPEQLALALANAKADALVLRVKEPAILITSDQVGACNGTIREKPTSREEVYRYYGEYAKYPIKTITAVAVVNTATGKRAYGVDIVTIYQSPVPEEVLRQLVEEGDIFNCAGGVQIENPLLAPYVEKIEGTLDSTMGMPLVLTQELIRKVQS